jgi:predicted DNA-binding antitoxin AbrB/MazE fold protein
MEPITAIYEDGVFKPTGPVALPEGAQVRVETENGSDGRDERIRRHLLAQGATRERADEILANFHVAWDAYDSLSDEQKSALHDCRLDQVNFFNRPSQ